MLYMQSGGELIDHVFLHCEVERELQSLISCLFRGCCIIPRTVLEVLASKKGPFGKKASLKIWKIISMCLMWYIWRERNTWTFKEQEISVTQLKFLSTILIYVGIWCQFFRYIIFFGLSLINWILDDFFWVLLCIHPMSKGSALFLSLLNRISYPIYQKINCDIIF